MKPAKKEGRGRPQTGQGIPFPARIEPELVAAIRAIAREYGYTFRRGAEKVIRDGIQTRQEKAAKREIIAS